MKSKTQIEIEFAVATVTVSATRMPSKIYHDISLMTILNRNLPPTSSSSATPLTIGTPCVRCQNYIKAEIACFASVPIARRQPTDHSVEKTQAAVSDDYTEN